MPDQDLSCTQLADLLPQLPDSLKLLDQHDAWEEKCMAALKGDGGALISKEGVLLYLFGDVHALVTTPNKLKRFSQLPYEALKAWLGSDNLVVDSEDSVVVALSFWIKTHVDGPPRSLTKQQNQQLCELIRVKHLTPGERLPAAVQLASLWCGGGVSAHCSGSDLVTLTFT
jgi:hypothetical protein